MSAQNSLYQSVLTRICATSSALGVPNYSITRLALLVSGIMAARSTVLARVAQEIDALGLTDATSAHSVERRLRRTLNDPNLTPQRCYAPLLSTILDWPQLLRGKGKVLIAIDESGKGEQIHLLRAGLCYWGGTVPLAWVSWPQNQAQEEGHYWRQIDKLFCELAALLPAGLRVVIVADRAYGVPNFIDRCRAQGWHYVVRLTSTGSHCWRELNGEEDRLRVMVKQHLGKEGTRWRRKGFLFKKAGWRGVNLVGVWRVGEKEPLVVVSDQAQSWRLIEQYERRFWIEAGFRQDKSGGWQWERSQVVMVEHNERLLLAMAWASVVTLCLGLEAAKEQLTRAALRQGKGKEGGAASKREPQRARQSIFTQGLVEVKRWLYGTNKRPIRWRLTDIGKGSWQEQWHQAQLQLPTTTTRTTTMQLERAA